MIKNIFFDMDGTLLPMDTERFTKGYFRYLTAKMEPHGYTPEKLIDTIWKGTAAMVMNDGQRSNEQVFWDYFAAVYGEAARQDEKYLAEFYCKEFDITQQFCGFNPQVPALVARLKKAGFRLVLATNPIFPLEAQHHRLRWAGLQPEDFSLVTSYETSCFCKPNPLYFMETLSAAGCKAEETLMIGNDASEDLAAQKCGIPVFLVTDCLLNRQGRDLSDIPHGDYAVLSEWLNKMTAR